MVYITLRMGRCFIQPTTIEARKEQRANGMKYLRWVLVACIWIGILAVCLYFKDEITVERIVEYTPSSPLFAAVIMMLLFALKSVTFFIYGGILYAASGVLFDLPAAIFVNMAGTVVMTSIPFLIGKKAGTNALKHLVKKNPKLEILQDAPNRNEIFSSFFVRIVGLLPGDLVGMYLGASGIRYSRYILGTLLGLLPAVVSFSIMGMSASDPSSPAFIISACFEVALVIVSIILYFIIAKRRKSKEQ